MNFLNNLGPSFMYMLYLATSERHHRAFYFLYIISTNKSLHYENSSFMIENEKGGEKKLHNSDDKVQK